MSFSIKNNYILSNLVGRTVLTPSNILHTNLVSNNRFIIKRDIFSDYISTSSLKLGCMQEGKVLSRSYGQRQWDRFGISNDRNVHDIIMPRIPTKTFHFTGLNDNDQFGLTVAIDGSTAVVGAPDYDGGKGAVFIYKVSNGVWEQYGSPITAPGSDLAPRGFGLGLAISGDTIVIGETFVNTNTGKVYVYIKNENGEWVQDGDPISGTATNSYFGQSVAISGNTIVIGEPSYVSDSVFGLVHIYTKQYGEWVEYGTPLSPLNAPGKFGYSVDIDNNNIIIGAPTLTNNTGVVYIYTKDSAGDWVQASGPPFTGDNVGYFYGVSVAILGETAVVGASRALDVGAVYIYKIVNDEWVLDHTIFGENIDDEFGISVAMDCNTLIVGAYNVDNGKGAAYIYNKVNDEWKKNGDTLTEDNSALFGVSVGVSGNNVIIGACPANIDNTDKPPGDAYIKNGVVYKGNINVRE